MKLFKWITMVTVLFTSSLAMAGPGKGCTHVTDIYEVKNYVSDEIDNDSIVVATSYSVRCTSQQMKPEKLGTLKLEIPAQSFPQVLKADAATILLQGLSLGDVTAVEMAMKKEKGKLVIYLPALWTPQSIGYERVLAAFKNQSDEMILINLSQNGESLLVLGEDI